jgi:acetoin utilization deacetylase AcuC-like enzyme
MNVLVFTHRAFGDEAALLDGQASPISAERHRRVIAALRAEDGVAWRDGREATRDELAMVHRPHYLDFVADLAAGRKRRVSDADFALLGPTVPIHADSWSMAACAAGTVMEAEAVRSLMPRLQRRLEGFDPGIPSSGDEDRPATPV